MRTSAACDMAVNPWTDLPHPTPAKDILKKSGNHNAVARLFSIFVQLNFKKIVIRQKKLNDYIV